MAEKAYLTELQYNVLDSEGSYTPIARVKSIKPPKVAAKDIDITTLESPDEAEEMLPGLANGGELEAVVEYSHTQTATLLGLFRDVIFYRINYPSDHGWQVEGYLSEIGDEEVVNGDIVRTTIKIKVTGL